MAWIEGIFGPDVSPGLTYAILGVIALLVILLIIWLFRKIFGSASARFNKNRQPRLSITDAAVVDDKRRLVLVRRDNVEHLVMIGGPSDIVVEQNIVRAAPVAVPQTTSAAQPAPMPPAPTPQAESGSSSGIGAAAATVGAAGAGLASAAGSTIGSAKQAVAETSQAAVSSVSDAASSATESVSEIASGATSSITGLADSAVETVSDAAKSAGDMADDLVGDLGASLGLSDSPSPEVKADTAEPTSKTEDEMQQLLDELQLEKR